MTNHVLKNENYNKKNSLQMLIINDFLTIHAILRDYIIYYVAHYVAHDE